MLKSQRITLNLFAVPWHEVGDDIEQVVTLHLTPEEARSLEQLRAGLAERNAHVTSPQGGKAVETAAEALRHMLTQIPTLGD